jgi:hypothetical protein
MHRSQTTNVAIFVALVLLALLAVPMILGHVYVADDLGEFHLPLRSFYAKQLAAGEPFDWCPDLYCGYYLTGEGQVGGYHPLHLLLYHTMPLPLAFDLECWLSYPAMLAGMVMFLLRRRLRFAAALFGAIVFTFGSFNFLHFVHPNAIAVVSHLPWLLWAIDVMLCSDNLRHRALAFVAIAGLTGSQWLLGYPQYVFYSLIVEAGYVVFLQRTPHAPRADRTLRDESIGKTLPSSVFARSVKNILTWLTPVGIGTLIGAVQLLPTFDALEHSVRHAPSAEFADSGSLHPLNLAQLVGPYLFRSRVVGQNTHELGLYLGSAPLVIALFGAANGLRKQRYRPLVISAMVTAILSLLWAFGTHGPFAWLEANIPIINSFRLPCRAIVVFQIAMALLAAVGFSILLRRRLQPHDPSENSKTMSWPWLLLFASAAAAAIAPLLWYDHISTWPLLAAGPLLIALSATLLHFANRGLRWALSALILLTAIDLGAYGLSYAIIGKTSPLNEFIRETNAPPGKPTSRIALDLLTGTQTAPGDGGIRTGNRILLTGWKRVDGYAGLEPARRIDYRDPKALQLAGVGWALSLSEDQNSWTPLSNRQSRAWLVTNTTVSQNPAADLATLSIHESALTDIALSLPAGKPGNVEILDDRPGEISLKTDCNTPQLLVVNESHHAGWQATIDSASSDILRVNGDFLGLVVPAGSHEIHLQFLPASLKFGRIASGCGLGLLVAALLLPMKMNG